MKLKPKNKLVEHFAEIEDPRIERSKRHNLIDILTIAILAVICGADSWVGMESFAQAKFNWLKRLLELPNGVPSHDTYPSGSKLVPVCLLGCTQSSFNSVFWSGCALWCV